MRPLLVFLLTVTLSFSSAAAQQGGPQRWTSLMDEGLSQWDIYLSYKIPDGYDGSIPLDSEGQEIKPLGFRSLNNQPVFSVLNEDSQPVIKVTGEYYGALITKAAHRNYHFRLKVKWGSKKWPPRLDQLKDSGILYHSRGEPGVEYYRSWMLSQEFQIMEGHMGDFWSQATSRVDIKAFPREYIKSPAADLRADWIAIGHDTKDGAYAMRSTNHESAKGEWTELELIAFEGKSLHIVNGQVVMALRNSRYVDDKGREQPLDSGKIQLQSEATEAFFKDIAIRPLDRLPAEYSAYFDD